jgi:MFS family permease
MSNAAFALPTPRTRTPLLALYGTTFISVTGDAMAAIAIPWFVLQTTGSATQTGITAFFGIVPIIIGMLFGGTLVDRIGYKRVSVFADVASGLTMLLIPILYYTVGLAFWQLLALVFLGNLLDAPGRSAKRAMLPELTQAAGLDIDRTSAWMNSVSRATAMIGAPIAGLLIAVIGAPAVLLLDALTFFISAVGLQLFISARLVEDKLKTKPAPYWQELKEGFLFVRQDALVMTFVVVIMITNSIDTAMFAVTMPIYAQTVFGKENGALYQGVMVSVFGGSALVGTLVYSWLGRRVSRHTLFQIGFFQTGLKLFFFATMPPFGLLLAAMGIGGVLAGPLNPIIDSVMYERTPRALRARVFGLLSAGVLVAMPFGALMAGVLDEQVGLKSTLILYGIVYVVATLPLFFASSVRTMDESPPRSNEDTTSSLQNMPD